MNEKVCPHCRFPNRRGARFCAMCGRSLGDGSASARVDSGNDDEIRADESVVDEMATAPRGGLGEDATAEEAQTIQTARSHDLRVGRRTHVGRVRELNEDSLLVVERMWSNRSLGHPVGFFVVADGMGGHEGGEIASGMLIRTLARHAPVLLADSDTTGTSANDPQVRLIEAIQDGNQEIYDRAREMGYSMGTTVVAALVLDERVFVAHVGDSRAYRVNAAGIERLTIDHSVVESLVVSNQISREEARDHPQANVIYRTIGDQPRISVDLRLFRLSPDDRLLLCSDGLTSMVADETIRDLVMSAASPQAACDALVNAANNAGGEDNCTVIVVEFVSI